LAYAREALEECGDALGDGSTLATDEELSALGHGVLDLLLEEAQLQTT
jgi:hypothetical protein